MSKINWSPKAGNRIVVETQDFVLTYVDELVLDLPFKGLNGFQMRYKPTQHLQAEGLDIVAAVAQTFREQRVLDRVKEKPSLLTEDEATRQMSEFLEASEASGPSN